MRLVTHFVVDSHACCLAVGHQTVNCSPVEFVRLDPPSGQTQTPNSPAPGGNPPPLSVPTSSYQHELGSPSGYLGIVTIGGQVLSYKQLPGARVLVLGDKTLAPKGPAAAIAGQQVSLIQAQGHQASRTTRLGEERSKNVA